jgi:hypothetical protein
MRVHKLVICLQPREAVVWCRSERWIRLELLKKVLIECDWNPTRVARGLFVTCLNVPVSCLSRMGTRKTNLTDPWYVTGIMETRPICPEEKYEEESKRERRHEIHREGKETCVNGRLMVLGRPRWAGSKRAPIECTEAGACSLYVTKRFCFRFPSFHSLCLVLLLGYFCKVLA